MADPNAVVRCFECGFPVPDAVTQRQYALALGEIERLEGNVHDLQAAVTEALAKRAAMARKLEDSSPDITNQDNEVFVAWCEATGRDPSKIKFGEGRQRAIKRMRRAGYKQDDLLLAVQLAGKFRFLVFGRWSATGSASDRKDDLIQIFADELRIESLLAKAGEE